MNLDIATMMPVSRRCITQSDFEQLLAFRTGLRRFLHWSGEQASAAGLPPAKHQLLLAIQGQPGRDDPRIGDLAESLSLRHHSVIGLIDRPAAAGLITRRRDTTDGWIVRISLTRTGPSGSRHSRRSISRRSVRWQSASLTSRAIRRSLR